MVDSSWVVYQDASGSAKIYHVNRHVISDIWQEDKGLTFSSACSTPVAIWFSVVRASYSEGSIWSSRRTGSVVLTLNFLTRTLRDDMLAGGRRGERERRRSAARRRKIREKKRSRHKTVGF